MNKSGKAAQIQTDELEQSQMSHSFMALKSTQALSWMVFLFLNDKIYPNYMIA